MRGRSGSYRDPIDLLVRELVDHVDTCSAGTALKQPPFGRRNSHVPWLRKFFDHGNGIGLVRAYTSSAWWHDEMPRAEMILFPRGKTKFVRADGSIGAQPGHGIALIGMGDVACGALLRSGLGMVWDRR